MIQRKGFTLVELSIVLVIIGLLIGGVLKGQSMIENAKIKKIISDTDALVAATYGYQDKFGTIPGDDSTTGATASGVAACNTVGNGDGLLTTAAERICAYRDLIDEGFITGDAAQTTEANLARKSPFGSAYLFRTAVVNGSNQNVIQIVTASVPADIALAVDTKYDDGVNTTGDIIATSAYTNTAAKGMTFAKF